MAKQTATTEPEAPAEEQYNLTQPEATQTETPPETPPETTPEATAETHAPEAPPEATTPATPEPTQPEQVDVLTQVKELGFDNVENEQQALEAMMGAYNYAAQQVSAAQEQAKQYADMARYGALYLESNPEARFHPAPPAVDPNQPPQAQPPQAPPQQPAQEPDNWWAPPQYDAAVAERYREVKLNEQGQPEVVWRSDTPPEVKQAATEHERYMEQWAENLVRRPQEVLPTIIEKEFDRLFEERIQQRERQAQLTQFADQVKQENQDWMYVHDPRTGQVALDQTTGAPVLSPSGSEVMQYVQDIAAQGVTDPQKQWLYAVALYDYHNGQQESQQQETATTAKETAATKRKQHLSKAGNVGASRAQSVVDSQDGGSSQNANLTPGQQLLHNLRQSGVVAD